jgi:ferredoxin
MPKVSFERERVEIDGAVGANLREVAIASKIPIYGGFDTVANCKGNGRCGTCRVTLQGDASPRNALEDGRLKNAPNVRLACQVQIQGDLRVKTVSHALDVATTLGFDIQGAPASLARSACDEIAAFMVALRSGTYDDGKFDRVCRNLRALAPTIKGASLIDKKLAYHLAELYSICATSPEQYPESIRKKVAVAQRGIHDIILNILVEES